MFKCSTNFLRDSDKCFSVIVSFVVVSFVIVAAFVVVWWSFDYVTVIFMLEFVGLFPYT